MALTPKQDAHAALLRYAGDLQSRADVDANIPGYPVEAVEHLKDVAYYLRLAAAMVADLPDIVEADGDEPSLPEQPNTDGEW